MTLIVFDIDGTLTSMWPVEKAILEKMLGSALSDSVKECFGGQLYKIYCGNGGYKLTKRQFYLSYDDVFKSLQLSKQLPSLQKFMAADFVHKYPKAFQYVYATGGSQYEAEYALGRLGILSRFDIARSISRDTCRFSKKTGIPFLRLKKHIPNKILIISDSNSDILGAQKASIPSLLIKPNQQLTLTMIQKALSSV